MASKRPDTQTTSSRKVGFLPEVLDRTVIAVPLLDQFKKLEESEKHRLFHIAIDLNLDYRKGIDGAREDVKEMIAAIVRDSVRTPVKQGVLQELVDDMQYVFATLEAEAIKELVRRDGHRRPKKSDRAIHHIWPDFDLKPLINKSISTVKGDAAHNAFGALGAGIVWAVIDSGIDKARAAARPEIIVVPRDDRAYEPCARVLRSRRAQIRARRARGLPGPVDLEAREERRRRDRMRARRCAQRRTDEHDT
jgi:hypothetical protein